MKKRDLADGVNLSGASMEEARDFVRGDRDKDKPRQHGGGDDVLPQMKARKAMTIKLRPEVASTLKRIAVLSQLRDERLTIQGIAEEAIEEWVQEHGHLAEFPDGL